MEVNWDTRGDEPGEGDEEDARKSTAMLHSGYLHEASLMQIPGKHPLIFPATEEGKATVKRKQRTQVISNQWTRKGATTAEEKIELY